MGFRSGHPFYLECIHEYKEPVHIKGFLNPEECDYLIKLAKPNLKNSEVGSGDVNKTIRDSMSSYIPGSDRIARKFRLKCSTYCNIPLSNFETLQVTHYKPGGYYDFHQDAWAETPNRRKVTFIVALNDGGEYEGGETVFPVLDKKFKFQKGDALFFYATTGKHNYISDMALHGGAPIISGEKWICNQFIQESPVYGEERYFF